MLTEIFIFFILLYLLYPYRFLRYNEKNKIKVNMNVPKIIHLISLPWDKNQKLKTDFNDFDHTYYFNLCAKYKDFEIKLWNLEKIKVFLNQNYPNVFELSMLNMRKPTQLVDLYRWIVVYHYGGIYLQYGSEIYDDILNIFPSHDKEVCLYTENVWIFDPLRWIIYLKKT